MGFEPTLSCVTGRRFKPLSYGAIINKNMEKNNEELLFYKLNIWPRSLAGLKRRPVTAESVGSNPIGVAGLVV